MSSKSTTNPVKVLKANPGMTVATLVVGAALATASWWYSDRLDLAFGQTPEINETGEDASSGYKAKRQAEIQRQQEACRTGCSYEVVNSEGNKVKITTTYVDNPYYRYIKTRTGFQIRTPITNGERVVGSGWQIKQEVIYPEDQKPSTPSTNSSQDNRARDGRYDQK